MPAVNQDWLERLPNLRKNAVRSYALAAGLFALTLALRWALRDILPDGLPYITFFIAVLLSTVWGGVGPGVMVVTGSVVSAWFLLMPTGTVGDRHAAIIASILFSVICGMIIYVVHLLNRTVERLVVAQDRAENQLYLTAMAEQQLAQLNGELRHRNKNTFAVLSSLVAQSARQETDVTKFSVNLRSRLSAMASAQDLMISSQFRGADLKLLVTETIAPIIPPGENRITVAGSSFFLPNDVASTLALVVHELATNCVKYGAWSNDAGRVECRWLISAANDEEVPLVFVWRETGGPPAMRPERTGLGTLLIERSLSNASVERSFEPTGMTCTITLTVAHVTMERRANLSRSPRNA